MPSWSPPSAAGTTIPGTCRTGTRKREHASRDRECAAHTRRGSACWERGSPEPLMGYGNARKSGSGEPRSQRSASAERLVSRQYVIRRILLMIPSIFGISVILYTVLALAPGDPFGELAQNPAIPPEVAAALRAKFGLDDPVWMRYWHWLSAMVQGDWGFSFASRINVETLIMQRLPTTLMVIG